MSKLSKKQDFFVKEYLVDLNATQAAIRAGYSKKTASRIGPENLEKPVIQEAIQAAFSAREKRTEITADFVLNNLKELVVRCMQGVEIRDKDSSPTGVWRFDSRGAARGLELLGKHLGLFTDKIQVGTDPNDPLMKAIARAQGLSRGLPKPILLD